MKAILTIDIGTSSIRGIMYDVDGKKIFTHQKIYSPDFMENNYVEQDPDDWINFTNDILENSLNFSRAHKYKIMAISMTAQRSSVIPVNKEGRPLHRAIMWQDRRTIAICEELSSKLAIVFKKTGLKIGPVFSAVKMVWFKKNMPEIYEKTHKMVGIQDFVIHHLTGRFVTDKSLASRTNLFNLHTREWDDELIEIFGIDKDMLCPTVEPGTIVAKLRPELLKAYNIDYDIPVISAGGDQQCAALGLGVMKEGDFEVNTGTGGYIIGHSEKPIYDEKMQIFCNASSIPGKYILEAGIVTSGNIYNWFNDNFYPDKDINNRFGLINKEVSATPAGSNGIILMPHFKGSGAPSWNPYAKGLFYNLSLESKRGHMARAILEGIVSETAINIKNMEAVSKPSTYISSAGGLSKFDDYNQMQADMFSSLIKSYSGGGEATTAGAFISAMVSLGLVDTYADAFSLVSSHERVKEFIPNPKNKKIYNDLMSNKAIIYNALDKEAYRLI